jgi:tetratricopeptide (TPR) repeat protein
MDDAELRHRTHQWHEAVEARRQELRLRKQVLAEFPSMMPYLPDLARCSVRLGDALRRIGAQDEAIAAYQEAIRACKEANRRQPENIGTYVWWGLALARTDAGAQAVAVWEQGVQQAADMATVAKEASEFLLDSTDPPVQNPEPAVCLAQKAVALAPQSGICWSTLGAACYRAGQWRETVDALEKALPLQSEGASVDGFFLAMAHWQLGEREKARAWYDRAVQGMDKNRPHDQELQRLRTEAAALLGIKEEPLNK